MSLLKIGQFLQIVNEDGKGLNLTDIAFIAIIVKIMYASSIDFPAVVTLATVCIQKMHKRSANIVESSEDVKQMSDQISNLKDKVTEVVNEFKKS